MRAGNGKVIALSDLFLSIAYGESRGRQEYQLHMETRKRCFFRTTFPRIMSVVASIDGEHVAREDVFFSPALVRFYAALHVLDAFLDLCRACYDCIAL